MSQKEYHTGIVRDNEDPDKKGRLMVECPTIVSGESLEWADPKFHFVDSSQQAGSFFIPNIGSQVEIEINSGAEAQVTDLEAKWLCTIYPDGTVPEEFQENYPYRRGWKTAEGHLLYFDDTDDDLVFHYTHPTGAYFEVNNDGDIILHPASGRHVLVDDGASEPMTLADTLKSYLDSLKIWLDALTLPVAGTVAGPPSASSPTIQDFKATRGKVK